MVIKRFKYKGGTKRREQREFGITTLLNGIKKHGLTEGFKRNFRYAGELKKLGRRSDKRLQNSIDGAISRYNSKALLKNPDYINYKHPDLDIKNEQNQDVLKSLLKNAHNKGIRVLYDNGVGMRTRKSTFF